MTKKITKCLCMFFVFAIILTGCSTSKKNNEQIKSEASLQSTKPFTTQAKFEYGGLSANLNISKEQEQKYDILFTSPESLSGMAFSVDGDKIQISYRDINMKMTTDEFFDSSVIKMIVSSLNKVTSQNGVDISIDSDKIIVGGSLDNGNFELILNKENMDMLSLCVPSADFKLKFENFNFI
ncbi:MAG: hypothetical protein RR048_02105 [Oscillospiraceae bacterium]